MATAATHASVLVYVFIWWYHRKFIGQLVTNCWRVNEATEQLQNSYFLLSLIFIIWNIFCILQLIDKCRQQFILIFCIYLEKLVIVLFEMQLCVILLNTKSAVNKIKDRILWEIQKQEVGK